MHDERHHPRYLVRWPAMLVVGDSGRRLDGRVHDLSVGGASVVSDQYLRNIEQLTLVLLPPPLSCGQAQKIVTVHSKLIYSVHSDEHMRFRVGLKFVRFEEDGRQLLEERLLHHAPVFESSAV